MTETNSEDRFLAELLLSAPTPEGLAIDIVDIQGRCLIREIGKLDYVIFQYDFSRRDFRREMDFQLQTLRDLDERCSSLRRSNPVPVELGQWRWNRKRGARRFRRWLEEQGSQILEVPSDFHDLVDRIVKEGPDMQYEFDPDRLIERFVEEGEIHNFFEYERRRHEHPPLIIRRLPETVRCLLEEANEAYFRRLFRAAIALCRAILEESLIIAARSGAAKGKVVPLQDDRLDRLITSFRPNALSMSAKSVAHKIKERGNRAMHDASATFSEEEVFETIAWTSQLVRYLEGRGFLTEVRG